MPVGAPSEVMVTMTTSTADPSSHRRPPTPLTSVKSSSILKELTDANSDNRCCGDDNSDPSPILRQIPTSNFQAANATAVVDHLDDDDNNLRHQNAQEDTIPFSTFLSEWEAFYLQFKQSPTYALAHSSADSTMPSFIVDDDDDDRTMTTEDAPPPSTFNEPLKQLGRSVQKLEKVNRQLAQLLESLEGQAPCQPALNPDVRQPKPCTAPQLAHPPQQVVPMEPQPAPNPFADLAPNTAPCHVPQPSPPEPIIPAWATPAVPSQEPQRDGAPQVVPKPAPPPAPNLTAGSNRNQQSPLLARRQSTVPNWAQPAVTFPVSAGVSHAGKPPPRPERKPIPFKKKTPTKPIAANQKDFLRPP